MVVPVPIAAPSAAFSARERMSWTTSREGLRKKYLTDALSGTTFGALPPSVIT